MAEIYESSIAPGAGRDLGTATVERHIPRYRWFVLPAVCLLLFESFMGQKLQAIPDSGRPTSRFHELRSSDVMNELILAISLILGTPAASAADRTSTESIASEDSLNELSTEQLIRNAEGGWLESRDASARARLGDAEEQGRID